MAHFAVSPSVIEMVQKQVPYGYQSNARKFLDEALNMVAEPKRALSGKVALVVSGKNSFLLNHALRSLGVAVRRVKSLSAVEGNQFDVDFLILGADAAENVSVDEIQAFRSRAGRVGVLAMGRNADELVELGMVDQGVSGAALDKQIYDALVGAEALGRIAHMSEPVRAVRVPVFHQPPKRRRSLFGADDAVELHKAA